MHRADQVPISTLLRPCRLLHAGPPFTSNSSTCGKQNARRAHCSTTRDHKDGLSSFSRRDAQLAAAAVLLSAAAVARPPPAAAALACAGMRGRELQQCLKKVRQEREGAESEAPTEGEKPKYDSIGELVTLPSGIQYREMETGTGREAAVGAQCEISYSVFRLASGAYFKNSSGGTPVYLFGFGDGIDFKGDANDVYSFRLGDAEALPRAAALAVRGMREGGRRRVLVPPQGGWTTERTQPIPASFGGRRRLATHRGDPLLFEAKLVRVRPSDSADGSQSKLEGEDATGQQPYRLPPPPSPYRSKLG